MTGFSTHTRAAVSGMIKRGYMIYQVSDALGISPVTVENIMRVEGLLPDAGALDTGKVRALNRAGWSLEEIADEFGGRFTATEIAAAAAGTV